MGHSLARVLISTPAASVPAGSSEPIQLVGRSRRARRRRQRRRRQQRNRAARQTFLGLPEEHAWQEIIDARHHEHGAQVYEQGLHAPSDDERADFAEPGYLQSAMNARTLVAQHIGTRIDADFLERVHDAASAHKVEDEFYHRGYRTRADKESNVAFAAPDDYTPDAGAAGPIGRALAEVNPQFTEAMTDVSQDEDAYDWQPASGQAENLELRFKPMRARALKAEVNNILGHYYRRIGRQRTQREKLRLIARTHRNLENLHPFLDANTRTNRLILHKLLVENGMTPVILDNPLNVHLKSHEEWADELEGGMARWQEAREQAG